MDTKKRISTVELQGNTKNRRQSILKKKSLISSDAGVNVKWLDHDRDHFTFVLLFNKTTGSDRVSYFMINPRQPEQILPKVNYITLKRLRYLTGHKAVTLRNNIYIIGGRDWNSGILSNAVMSYNPDSNAWKDHSPMNIARSGCNVDIINENSLFVTGGEISRTCITDTVESYDSDTDQWTLLRVMPLPRVCHASCVINDTVYVSGGVSKLTDECSNVFWAYNCQNDTWYEPISGVCLPKEVEKHSMVAVEHDKLLLIGGRSFDEDTFRERDESRLICYDTKVKVNTRREPCWSKLYPSMFHARSNAASITIGETVYMIGGRNFSKGHDVLTVEAYHMIRRKWSEVFTLPTDGSYSHLDCCLIRVPRTNTEFSFIDSYLYDNWIMW